MTKPSTGQVAAPAIVPISSLTSLDPLKRDFRNFMYKSWMTWFGNAPTSRMYEVGERLQNGPKRDIIMGFRGLSKSFITVDFGVFTLYCDPTEIVLTVSGSEGGAKGNAFLAWGMISQWDWLAHMKPTGTLRQSAQAFDVQGSRMEKSESFAAMSLFGQVTSRRGSLIIPDDIETPNTSETEGDRSRMRVRNAELGGAILKPGGRIKTLGTAQTEDTIYLELATEKGYGLRMWPAEYPRISADPKKDELKHYGVWLAPSILAEVTANPELAGTSTEPTRFTEEDLAERKVEYGALEYERQFKLWMDAGQGLGNPLRLRDIPVVEISMPGSNAPLLVPSTMQWSPVPANAYADIHVDALTGDGQVFAPMMIAEAQSFWVEPEGKTLIVDPSGGGSDETAWGVLVQHLGRVGLVHMAARLEGFSAETMRAIAEDAKKFTVHKIHIEKNFGGGMFGELLRPHLAAVGYACTIEEANAGSVQKEIRIVDTLQGLVTGHRLWIAAHVLREDWDAGKDYPIEAAKRRAYRLTYQLTRITKRKGVLAHDDRIDFLATGVASFMGTLRRELEAALQESKENYLNDQIEKLIELRRAQGLPLFGHEAGPSKLGNFINQTINRGRGQQASVFFKGKGRA